MFGFLKSRSQSISKEEEITKLVKKIENLERIIEEIDKKDNNKVEYHITVEKININDPVLESLTFQLDSLDIQDLSGALNLGTNFGVSVNQDDTKKKKKDEKGSPLDKETTESQKDKRTVVNKNDKGYSFKFNSNE